MAIGFLYEPLPGHTPTVHYENPRLIVCCAAYWLDKILMCRRALEPGLGKWVVPSGFLEVGESLEQGAVRELWTPPPNLSAVLLSARVWMIHFFDQF